MLNGSCVANAPAPTVTPERLRNVRRSMVCVSAAASPCDKTPGRAPTAEVLPLLLVSNIAASLDERGAVVLAHMLAEHIPLACIGLFLWTGSCILYSFDHHDRPPPPINSSGQK